MVGIFAIVLLPDLADPEMAIFEAANALLPAAVTGLVMAAIMAAIMSTADSLLLQVGSIASRDLYERFVNPDASEAQGVRVSRGLVLAIAVIGYVVALYEPPSVFGIVVFATTVLGSAFLPAYVCAVWWRKANAPGALASILSGAVVSFVWQYAGLAGTTQLDPMLVGVAVSTTAMIVVSLLTQQSHPVPEDIVAAMDEADRLGPIPAGLRAATSPAMAAEASEIGRAIDNQGPAGD